MPTTTTVNQPFPWPTDFDGASGSPGVVALQPSGASVAQTGDINVSGSITGSNLVSGNVKVGTLGTADANAENWIQQATASKKPLIIQLLASPTNDPFEIQDSTGAILLKVNKLGATFYSTNAVTNETLLKRNTAVDFNTATATTLFTCPTGFSCIINKVIISAASTSLTTASVSFGWESTTFANVIANATHTELTGATLYTSLAAKTGATIGTTGGTFKMLCNTLQGGACTATVDVFGILY